MLPLARVHHLWCLDLTIAGIIDCAAHIGFQLTPDDKAMRMPEDTAMCFLLQVEQVHFCTQAAMVALRCFFKADEVCVELLLVQPASAVNTRQLCIFLVAAPIGARDAGQLERRRIKFAGRGQMRSAAHVHPVIAGPIDRKFLALGQFGCPFGLEAFARSGPCCD